MYITTIYSNLSKHQKRKLNLFLKSNFDSNGNFEFEQMTIIILDLLDDVIIGCVCLFDNKFLLDKLELNNVETKNYSFNGPNTHGCFIYNLCVDKNHRNQKVGNNLLCYTMDKMRELNIEYLHTHAESEISRMLFLKNGFMEDNQFTSINNDTIFSMSKYL
jgi:ribosomal protein S18 acetylase RimI-like enzyme